MESNTPDQRLRLPALQEYRAATAARRAAAFCDAPEYVLGTLVRPLTPATFSMLYATQSAFLSGGSAKEHDVRNYIWFHSPSYVHTGVRGWESRKKIALSQLTFELYQPWRKWVGAKPDLNRYLAALSIAIAEILILVDQAFADAPPKSGRPGKPIATLEAFFVHEFAAAYQWAPERTQRTPLRQLMQLHRCIRSARGEEIVDDGEDKILHAHLKARNEALALTRKTK